MKKVVGGLPVLNPRHVANPTLEEFLAVTEKDPLFKPNIGVAADLRWDLLTVNLGYLQ